MPCGGINGSFEYVLKTIEGGYNMGTKLSLFFSGLTYFVRGISYGFVKVNIKLEEGSIKVEKTL